MNEQLSEPLRQEVRQLLLKGQPLAAIRAVAAGLGLGLEEAKACVDAFETQLREALPGAVRKELRLMLARGAQAEAVKTLQARGGLSVEEAKAMIEALGASFPFRLPAAVEAEIKEVLASQGIAAACMKVRERAGVGLGEAKQYVDTVFGTSQDEGELKCPHDNSLSPAVMARVEADFPETLRETVVAVLADCTAGWRADPSWDPLVERVHMALLNLAKGDSSALLQLADSASRDYRDVLLWGE